MPTLASGRGGTNSIHQVDTESVEICRSRTTARAPLVVSTALSSRGDKNIQPIVGRTGAAEASV